MFTKNWYKLEASRHSGKTFTFTLSSGADKVQTTGATDSYGTQYMATFIQERIKTIISGYGTAAIGVMFGNGTTPPTVNDRMLSGNYISNLSATTTISNGVTENGASITVQYTITNGNSESVTISEIGLFYRDIMFDRTLLDEPVTIPSGDVGRVTYTLNFNWS